MKHTLKLAERYGGVSAIHLSHHLVHHADDVMTNPDRLAQVRKIVSLAKAQRLDVWCWTHEMYRPPAACVTDGMLDLEHPDLQPHLEQKYAEFLQELLPGLEGLVLTFAETQFEVYKDKNVLSSYTGPEAAANKTKQLVQWLLDSCSKHGAKLTVRDFVYRDHEIADMLKAIRSLPDEVGVMSKCVPHDWHPYYPDNPVLSQVRPKPQWIEFDLGHEYEMQTVLPFAEPELLLRRARHARTLGIETFCLRLDRYDADAGNSAVYTPWGQLELQVFSRFAANPDIKLDQIIADWEKEHFEGAWEVVGLSTEIVRRMLFPQKLWLADHSNLPTFDYARKHLKDGNADRLPVWTGSPVDRLAEQLCDRPTKEWVFQLRAEDEKTSFYMNRLSSMMNRGGRKLAETWREALHALQAWEELFRQYKAAYFGIRLLQNDPDAVSVHELRMIINILEQSCADFKEQFPNQMLSGRRAWESHAKVIESLRNQLDA
ncbi:hypothetical protein [Paenibacillus sp. H1-7]|uniref:hypothetical protein n=1 Tax=Paenibacillus sp. H1-7 TaxID=2282849 RepID=UPI001EF8C47B|nr:hypothetical protein [Paenibacillus sp. H1-7]